ncbi:MAG TPA: sulfotransferase [Mycobacteriales bacterium]|nr:sulfotransferase [Mycobacteriales bacterium]
MSEAIRIEDLAHPRFSPEVADIRTALAAMAADCPLDSDALHRKAVEETGLEDFGVPDYRERLDVLLAAFRDVPGLSDPGRFSFYSQLLQLLKNRLLLTDLLTRHPEIHEVELAPPIIIAGLPRTGTTHLHNLLAAGPAFRTLPYWESLEPIPVPGEYGVDPDPRLARTEQAVWFTDLAMPLFPLMHEMTVDHVHEEIQLLAIDFSTMLFETLAQVPAWRDYYCSHDQRPHYEFLRTMLKVLQHLRGGRRWLLKSPQHLEQLPVLAEVFPDATVVLTHRDPCSVVVSMATMVAYTARMHTDTPDPVAIGSSWADRLERMLNSCVRDRSAIAASQSVDVTFEEFMSDDLATARRVYELAGEPLTLADEQAMSDYLGGHRRGRHGTIDYRAQDVGLDLDDLRGRFAPYTARFL